MQLGADTVGRVVSMWKRWERGATFDTFDGVSIVSVGAQSFVCAPQHLQQQLTPAPDTVDDLIERLGPALLDVVSDDRLAYAESATLRLPVAVPTVDIDDDDPRLAALAADADPAEWMESSCDEPSERRIAILDTEGISSLACLQVWASTVAHLCVFTRRDRRGHGEAAYAVSPLIADAFTRGLVPQWRSRIDNIGSCRVADRLGFVPLGHQIFARIRPVPG